MAEEPDSLVLRYLRGIDQKFELVAADVGDLKTRVTSLERGMANIEMSIAGVQHRIDRVDQRLDRIEGRLELIDSPHGGVRE